MQNVAYLFGFGQSESFLRCAAGISNVTTLFRLWFLSLSESQVRERSKCCSAADVWLDAQL